MPLPRSGLSEDRELPLYLADQVEQIIRDYTDTNAAAIVILERVSQYLNRSGWRSPETIGQGISQISAWSDRVRQIPEHNVSHDLLISHLRELAEILHML